MPKKPTPLFLVYGCDAIPRPLYRIVERCPPEKDDFRSYEALGKQYDRRDFFRGVGVSMHTTRERSLAVAGRFEKGSGIAELDLHDVPLAWTESGGRGHVTVWAPPEVLLAHVIQCRSHE